MRRASRSQTVFAICIIFAAIIACSKMSSVPGQENPNRNAAGEPPSNGQTPPPALDTPPPTTQGPPPSSSDLEKENIGTKARVQDVFDQWTINAVVSGGRGRTYADVTTECWGKIEPGFALTAQQWRNPQTQSAYYRSVDQLIDKVGNQLLGDRGNALSGDERTVVLRALKALAWQESLWQHYLRHKDWFFVVLSGGSYNALDDWGITQVARSGFTPNDLLNPRYFASLGHCSISTSLSYGYTEYYDNYMEARRLTCNDTGDPMSKILGAYNKYSSGFSLCHDGLSTDPAYRDYQVRAMDGLKTHYQSMPWQKKM